MDYVSVGCMLAVKVIRIGRESEKKEGKTHQRVHLANSSSLISAFTFVALFFGFSSSKGVHLLGNVF